VTSDDTTYDVRVYRTEVYKGARVTTTYQVRWKTDRRLWKEGFRNAALADSFRSSLLTAARRGEAFSLSTGRSVSWKRDEPSLTWYALTLDYAAYAKCVSGQQAEAERRIEEATRPRQDP
jgi:hypothetical protein